MKTKDCLRHFHLHRLCLIFIVIIIIIFFYLLELYCLFFHSEHEREVKRQDKFAILEVINYQAFFFFFRVLALFNMVFIRKMWCNRSDCAFHDVYFLLYSPIYKLQILCYCLKSITTELS